MKRFRSTGFSDPRRSGKSGLMYLGALREIFVISLAVGVVMATIWRASSVLGVYSSSQDDHGFNCREHPVFGLAIDQDRQVLVVHTWPGELSEISLEAGTDSPRRAPQKLVSAATSERNSTTVLLSERVDAQRIHHHIDVVRPGEVLLSDEICIERPSSAETFISADGSIAVVIGHEGFVVGWDLTGSNPLRWEFPLSCSAHTTRLAPDGRRLFIAADDGQSFLCDARTGMGRIPLTGIEVCCRSAAWSSDGQRLAVGGQSGKLHIFDTATGAQIWQEQLDFEFARSVAFSNDGTLLAVGGFDERIRVWDYSHPAQSPQILMGHTGVVHNIVFTSSDNTLVSGSLDGTIREWSLADRELIRPLR